MSFTFNWPRFSDQFHYDAIQMLNTALNKGSKPPVIADKIEVVELEMGTQPPELEIRDIGDLTVDQFRGIFRLTYAGDAHLVLKTKVQANPLNHKQPDIHLMAGSRGMLAAKQPLVVPMLLRLSHFKLNSYVVLVVSKQKGITLVFKTDPLQNVDINSTFDSIAVIQKFIQREIEGQLRQMFREDLPGIIHRLSQQWVKAKVEAPYLTKRPPPPTRHGFDTRSTPDLSYHPATVTNVGLQPQLLRQQPLGPDSYRKPRSSSGISVASTSRRTAATAPKSMPLATTPATPDAVSSFPDLENFDPTYGLRPEGLPIKSVFQGFSSLFTPNKGLADLAEEPSDAGDYDDEIGSFDVVDWDNMVPDVSSPPTVFDDRESHAEYETIPAVGGGTITRPRIYHSQSMIQSDLPTSSSMPSFSGLSRPYDEVKPPRSAGLPHSVFGAPGLNPRRSNSFYNPYFSEFTTAHNRSNTGFNSGSVSEFSLQPPNSAPPFRTTPGRPVTPDSMETQPSRSSTQSVDTPPPSDPAYHEEGAIYMRRPPSERRLSVSSSNLDTFHSGSPPNQSNIPDSNPKIVLRPSLNNSIHQLSTLSHSNHTLSPYTRSLEHFTVRSVPPRSAGPSGIPVAADRQPVKAKRKRIYRLGGNPKGIPHVPEADVEKAPLSPTPTSEFDASDMDLYFRSHDDRIAHSPNIHPTHVRRRQSYHPA